MGKLIIYNHRPYTGFMVNWADESGESQVTDNKIYKSILTAYAAGKTPTKLSKKAFTREYGFTELIQIYGLTQDEILKVKLQGGYFDPNEFGELVAEAKL